MSDMVNFRPGESAVLVSIPHCGLEIPGDIVRRMSPAGRRVADTDWHVDRLYDMPLMQSVSVISARYSRYVVDLNRPADGSSLYPGQDETGLCPSSSFDGEPLYSAGEEPDSTEAAARVETYWQPYHDKISTELQRLREIHGFAILWDAHSIRSVVPRFFQGQLPDLNIGTVCGTSCAAKLRDAVSEIAHDSPYSMVCDGRFQGGYITRRYGQPEDGVHALQLELSQRRYMDEATFEYLDEPAARLRKTLSKMIRSLLDFRP